MGCNECDVAVIGAGPAGSVVAKEISKKGYKVLLIEKDVYPGEKNVCAGGINKDHIKNLNLPNRIIEKEILKSVYHYPWATYNKNISQITVLRRVFDKFLAEKAVEEGTNLLTSTLAFDLAINKKDIEVFIKDRVTGAVNGVKAKIAIFADGPSTLVSRKFKGIGLGREKMRAFAAIYEIEWRNNPLKSYEFFVHREVSPWGYGWIFPKRDLLNVGVGCLLPKLRKNIRTHLDFLVDEHPVASKRLSGRPKKRFSASIIPFEHADKIHADRIMVVGDAAGMVDPIWGGGIVYGIRGSMLAAKTAVMALEANDFTDTYLSRYEREWENGDTFKHLRKLQLFIRPFLFLSKLDKYAYYKLHRILALKM